MNTIFLLLAKYNGAPLIPTQTVCADFFAHLSVEAFEKKCGNGDIKLPIVRPDPKSQKGQRHININDLATWLDARTEAARKEASKLYG